MTLIGFLPKTHEPCRTMIGYFYLVSHFLNISFLTRTLVQGSSLSGTTIAYSSCESGEWCKSGEHYILYSSNFERIRETRYMYRVDGKYFWPLRKVCGVRNIRDTEGSVTDTEES